MKTLLLWDIDLTLIDLGGLSQTWYAEALAAVAGVSLQEMPSLPGRTERAITSEALTAHGIEPTEDLIQQMWKELIAVCTRTHTHFAEHGQALSGAAEALAAVSEQPDIVQSLVTGNLYDIAWLKLSAFDLHRHVDFDIGGYGSLSVDRHELVATAITRAGIKHGRVFAPGSVVVLGDTPDDVAAAQHHGAAGIGVATGRHTAHELHNAGADAVLGDLTDTDTVLAAIRQAVSPAR